MADTLTPTYKFTKPEVGASDDTWGGKLNANWQHIEDLLKTGFTGGTETTLGRLTDASMPNDLVDPLIVKNTFTVEHATPQFRIHESDQASPGGWWRFVGEGGVLRLQAATGPAGTPWDTVENAISVNKSVNTISLHYLLSILNVATFSQQATFLGPTQHPTSLAGTALFTDVPISGAGNRQLRLRFNQTDSNFVISDQEGAWIAYNPSTQTFETSSYFSLAARTIVERLDVMNAGSSTIYFGVIGDPDSKGYISSFGAETLQMRNANAQSGFDLAADSFNVFGSLLKTMGGHVVLGDASGVETGRLFEGTNGTTLRNVAGGGVTGQIEIQNDGDIVITGLKLTAPIYAATLPQPGTAPQEVAERSRIAGHRATLGFDAHSNLMFAMHTQSGNPSVGHGTIVTGEKLRPANAQPDNAGAPRPNTETWMCLGFIGGSANASERTTMWRRIT